MRDRIHIESKGAQYDVAEYRAKYEGAPIEIRLSCMMGGAVISDCLSLSEARSLITACFAAATAMEHRLRARRTFANLYVTSRESEYTMARTKVQDPALPPISFTIRCHCAVFSDYLTGPQAASLGSAISSVLRRIETTAKCAALWPNDTPDERAMRVAQILNPVIRRNVAPAA